MPNADKQWPDLVDRGVVGEDRTGTPSAPRRSVMHSIRALRIGAVAIIAALSLTSAFTHARSWEQQYEPPDSAGVPEVVGAAPTPLYSFVVLGDDRADPDSPEPSKANVYQLNRSFSEIATLVPKPGFVIFNGDLVYGVTKTSEGETQLGNELDAWIKIYNNSPLRGGKPDSIPLIPVPGNHELNIRGGQRSFVGAEKVWLDTMKPLLPTGIYPGPNKGTLLCGKKKLESDQTKLTYSFDIQDSLGYRDHFLILNTDPQSPKGGTGNVSAVPLTWIKNDLEAAHNNPNVWHIFAFGHKNAYQPGFLGKCADLEQPDSCGATTSCDGLNFRPGSRDQLFRYFNDAEVAAYFTGHLHLWHRSAPTALKHTWQVIAGNAGAPLIASWDQPKSKNPRGYFGFTVVKVMPSGRVLVASYGRDFNREDPFGTSNQPTTLRDCFCTDFDGGAEQACNSKSGLPVTSNVSLACQSEVVPTPTPTPTAVPAQLGVKPLKLAFGQPLIGKTTVRRVLLVNTAKKSRLNPNPPSIRVSGINTDNSQFNAVGCVGAALAPGQSCKVTVSFTPQQAGQQSGKLWVSSNAANPTVGVPLVGVGRQPRR